VSRSRFAVNGIALMSVPEGDWQAASTVDADSFGYGEKSGHVSDGRYGIVIFHFKIPTDVSYIKTHEIPNVRYEASLFIPYKFDGGIRVRNEPHFSKFTT